MASFLVLRPGKWEMAWIILGLAACLSFQGFGMTVIIVVLLGDPIEPIDPRVPARQTLLQFRHWAHVLLPRPMKLHARLAKTFLYVDTPTCSTSSSVATCDLLAQFEHVIFGASKDIPIYTPCLVILAIQLAFEFLSKLLPAFRSFQFLHFGLDLALHTFLGLLGNGTTDFFADLLRNGIMPDAFVFLLGPTSTI